MCPDSSCCGRRRSRHVSRRSIRQSEYAPTTSTTRKTPPCVPKGRSCARSGDNPIDAVLALDCALAAVRFCSDKSNMTVPSVKRHSSTMVGRLDGGVLNHDLVRRSVEQHLQVVAHMAEAHLRRRHRPRLICSLRLRLRRPTVCSRLGLNRSPGTTGLRPFQPPGFDIVFLTKRWPSTAPALVVNEVARPRMWFLCRPNAR